MIKRARVVSCEDDYYTISEEKFLHLMQSFPDKFVERKNLPVLFKGTAQQLVDLEPPVPEPPAPEALEEEEVPVIPPSGSAGPVLRRKHLEPYFTDELKQIEARVDKLEELLNSVALFIGDVLDDDLS